jgi:hypothetical protein
MTRGESMSRTSGDGPSEFASDPQVAELMLPQGVPVSVRLSVSTSRKQSPRLPQAGVDLPA